MGGEKWLWLMLLPWLWGSPPHGRGKGSAKPQSEQNARITPAWAGKRQGVFSTPGTAVDHPRMGGEKAAYEMGYRDGRGSPPHGRGKAYIFRTFWGVERITPAWAGKSRLCSRGLTRAQDHPRMGGEKQPSRLAV